MKKIGCFDSYFANLISKIPSISSSTVYYIAELSLVEENGCFLVLVVCVKEFRLVLSLSIAEFEIEISRCIDLIRC